MCSRACSCALHISDIFCIAACFSSADSRELDIQRLETAKVPCCDRAFGTCPFETLDALYERCTTFCADGQGTISVPVIVGGESFGLDLEQAASVCLDPNLLGAPYNKDDYDACEDGKSSLQAITDVAAEFVSEMRKVCADGLEPWSLPSAVRL